jgi:predicted oxidoreductase
MLSGVPDYVDGLLQEIVNHAGGRIINPDRMWHYPEGLLNYAPVWSAHGIRILSGPTPLWLDAHGRRLPPPLYPGFDSLGALRHITSTGYDHSWFLLNQRTIGPEFALSGSEQNPDLTGKDLRQLLGRARPGPTQPVADFLDKGEDFVVRKSLHDLVKGMNELIGEDLVDLPRLEAAVVARDRQIAGGYGKDHQVTATTAARRYVGDRLTRIVKPHRLLDPDAGPLIAVRLWILTRKTLGGLETDLAGRVLQLDGSTLPGVYAAGEVAGFGGGGVHGYRALEGTFLGGCLFSGRVAGRALAAATA